MLFYAQLQQMDGKWNDKWKIMVRKWMKGMSTNDGKIDNSRAQQHHPRILCRWKIPLTSAKRNKN